MKIKDKISTFIFYLSIFLFIFAFNFQHNPPSGWYQQFLPDVGGRQIADIFFLDSLTGWTVTEYVDTDDTAYVLKTTNGGDNWNIAHTRTGGVGFKRIYFLNGLTGFSCGANDFNGYSGLSKSSDGGLTWNSLSVPDPFVQFDDMSVLNSDTIWLAASSSLTGGLFRTTNGGTNWTQQFSAGSNNPRKIYMYDANTGFMSAGASNSLLLKTTNSGVNWVTISGEAGFTDIEFIDTNTGWKARNGTNVQYTTNGGLNWAIQNITQKGPNVIFSRISELSVINKDTIWGFGRSEYIIPGPQIRGMIHITTDGGNTWGFQLPDTNIAITSYRQGEFINKLNGWAFALTQTGIHTVTGGEDTTIFLELEQISNEIPKDFSLYQNYPNPFNPSTIIKFKVQASKNIALKVYDITGKGVTTIVDKKLSAGEYEVSLDAGDLPSGIYFYTLYADGVAVDTKKMMLIK